MITLRFVTGTDFVSRAIRAGERDGWCTHVEALMPDGTLLGAHLDGGVMPRGVGYDKTTMARELYVSLPNTAETFVADKFHDFLRAQIGKPYDALAIAGFVLDRDWRETDSWFCSELIAAGLEACGYLPPLSAIDNHVSPRDLLLVLSGRFKIDGAM